MFLSFGTSALHKDGSMYPVYSVSLASFHVKPMLCKQLALCALALRAVPDLPLAWLMGTECAGGCLVGSGSMWERPLRLTGCRLGSCDRMMEGGWTQTKKGLHRNDCVCLLGDFSAHIVDQPPTFWHIEMTGNDFEGQHYVYGWKQNRNVLTDVLHLV